MPPSVGASHFVGLAQAGAWNSVTSVGSRVDMPALPGGLKLDKPPAQSGQTRGMIQRFGRYGGSSCSGDIAGDWFAEGWTKIISTAFSMSTSNGTNFKTHTFSVPDATGTFDNPYGLVLYDHRDIKTFRYKSAFANSLSWTFSESPFVAFKAGMIAASRTRENAVTPMFGTAAPMTPYGDGSTTGLVISAVVNGNTYSSVYYRQASINIKVPTAFLKSGNLEAPVDVMRDGHYEVTGSWTWVYNSTDALSEDWMSDWDSGDLLGAITFTLVGGTIATSSPTTPYTLQITIPAAIISGEEPVVGGPGAIEQSFNFAATVATVGGSTPTLVLKNNESLP